MNMNEKSLFTFSATWKPATSMVPNSVLLSTNWFSWNFDLICWTKNRMWHYRFPMLGKWRLKEINKMCKFRSLWSVSCWDPQKIQTESSESSEKLHFTNTTPAQMQRKVSLHKHDKERFDRKNTSFTCLNDIAFVYISFCDCDTKETLKSKIIIFTNSGYEHFA